MALAPSSLSQACDGIKKFVKAGVRVPANEIDVRMGHPAAAAPDNTSNQGSHRLNLFFFKIETGGFQSDLQPKEPWMVRLQCLITPFSHDETVGQSTTLAGENDLRIIGEVLRLFHETPVLPLMRIEEIDENNNGRAIDVRVDAVMKSIGLEELNNLWGTQGSIPYRPSLCYEMALTPIIPEALPEVVGLTGEISPDVDAPPADGQSGPVGFFPPGDIRIAFLKADNKPSHSLSLEEGPALATFKPSVLFSGPPGARVTLRWLAWGGRKWQPAGQKVTATIEHDTTATLAERRTNVKELNLPANTPGQYLLYAQKGVGGKPPNAPRSNQLLLTISPGGGNGG